MDWCERVVKKFKSSKPARQWSNQNKMNQRYASAPSANFCQRRPAEAEGVEAKEKGILIGHVYLAVDASHVSQTPTAKESDSVDVLASTLSSLKLTDVKTTSKKRGVWQLEQAKRRRELSQAHETKCAHCIRYRQSIKEALQRSSS